MKLFHRCKFMFENFEAKNIKGTIQIEKCKCGKKRRIIFNSKDECISIKAV